MTTEEALSVLKLAVLMLQSTHPNTHAAARIALEAMEANTNALTETLDALTDAEGHIWHGTSGECTGECRDVRAALAKARGEP